MGSIPIVGSVRYLDGLVTMAKKAIRMVITLACTECKEHNYTSEKNRRNDPSRLELKKYCPRCRAHTVHRETQ